MSTNEKRRLDALGESANYSLGLNSMMIKEFIRAASIYFVGEKFLEMGSADGTSTEVLQEFAKDLELVEGSSPLCKKLQIRFPSVVIHNVLFEDFLPKKLYDTILLSHVLEHVEDPLNTLKNALDWLQPGGRLIIGVPNSNSIHRQIGVLQRKINHQKELHKGDVGIGHRRVFDTADLTSIILGAGGDIVHMGGFWLKMLSNEQLENLLSERDIRLFMQLGSKYPELSADLLAVVSKR